MEKVLVTGASGFIAEHCIIELLKNGYSVKGSLRTMNREQEVRDAVKTETDDAKLEFCKLCLLYTSPSPRDTTASRMPSSA